MSRKNSRGTRRRQILETTEITCSFLMRRRRKHEERRSEDIAVIISYEAHKI
jgi:hypothetical protein